jgi:cytochrome c nitrite reductase small subunit
MVPSQGDETRKQARVSNAALMFAVALGALAGLGSYTFSYAKGLSYFSTDPRACVNCHIMQPEYDGWQKASHHTSAVCIDCHLPHDFVPKYLAKAENGWRHGKLFTTGGFVEPIEVKPAGRQILEDNCVRCHAALTAEMRGHDEKSNGKSNERASDALSCLHCHSTVGHGEKAGLGGPSSELAGEER